MDKKITAGDRTVSLADPVVMAIVNVTPDSFYAGSRTRTAADIRAKVRKAVEEGASIIDIGGYSSRPGAADVSPEEELARVLPAVAIVREEFPDMMVSLDTFRSRVACGVMERFGACIVNDISAGELDSGMMAAAAEYGAPYIAMHMRGTPSDMQTRTGYGDIAAEVTDYLRLRAEKAAEAGVKEVILDPGFGFAKTVDENYRLLAGMRRLARSGLPVLAGISRKSMIYKVLGCGPEDALYGTTALHWECLRQGADILRVHDVRAAADTVRLFVHYRKHGYI